MPFSPCSAMQHPSPTLGQQMPAPLALLSLPAWQPSGRVLQQHSFQRPPVIHLPGLGIGIVQQPHCPLSLVAAPLLAGSSSSGGPPLAGSITATAEQVLAAAAAAGAPRGSSAPTAEQVLAQLVSAIQQREQQQQQLGTQLDGGVDPLLPVGVPPPPPPPSAEPPAAATMSELGSPSRVSCTIAYDGSAASSGASRLQPPQLSRQPLLARRGPQPALQRGSSARSAFQPWPALPSSLPGLQCLPAQLSCHMPNRDC